MKFNPNLVFSEALKCKGKPFKSLVDIISVHLTWNMLVDILLNIKAPIPFNQSLIFDFIARNQVLGIFTAETNELELPYTIETFRI